MVAKSNFLDSVTKFNITNPKSKDIFREQEFFKWSNQHFYRTSTHDMSSKVSDSPTPRHSPLNFSSKLICSS